MRYSVNNKNMYATLAEEMHHVKAYVKIINIRYEDSIQLVFEIPEELQKACVVKLLLQPLVENACVHGILPKPEQRGNICGRRISWSFGWRTTESASRKNSANL